MGLEREFEIGKDEAWFANVKRTYDNTSTKVSKVFGVTGPSLIRL